MPRSRLHPPQTEPPPAPWHGITTRSPRLRALFELIENLAHSTATVLIEGETGTGKELIARAIHAVSAARPGPFVALNCVAVPETLLESELFGHEKGSFTGATAQRVGRFEAARGGTLFLDEIGDISPATQAKLLRVLQEWHIERIGSGESIPVDVRVVTATNKSLARQVQRNRFREDLYYRLNVVKIDVPPLRDRPEDVPLLVEHFLAKHSPAGRPPRQIAPRAVQLLAQAPWPGNVRQLENLIERLCITVSGDVIDLSDLPEDLCRGQPLEPGEVDLNRPLPELIRETTARLEKDYICKALRRTGGHVGRCARLCGMSRRTMTTKIAQYHLDPKVFRPV